MIAAWAVDRLGRSLQGLVHFLDDLRSLGINLYLHQQRLDTSTPSGRALFQMLGVFAEFERAMINERVKAGLARTTKKLGRASGRPHRKADEVLQLRTQSYSIRQISRTLSIRCQRRAQDCQLRPQPRLKVDIPFWPRVGKPA
jgi:DNA invertase Pin-like site-specific DNA recombinase